MDYKAALKEINRVQKRGSVFGLETIRELLKRLGNPQDQLKVIHVAGTNGKGSICAFLEAIYRAEGLRVGRYVSPTLFTYLERFQVNGSYMQEEEFAGIFTQVEEAARQMEQEGLAQPTAFELETAVAFLYFVRKQVDLVLLETGMGGRLDATNVVARPLCTVFASIGRDHMQVLGNTLADIAREKAGIMREGCPVVTFPERQEVMDVLAEEAAAHHAPFCVVEEEQLSVLSQSLGETRFCYKGSRYVIHLAGAHQVRNAAVAIQTKLLLSGSVRTESLADAVWPGRFEVLSRDPLLIRDGAHNPDGAKALRDTLQAQASDRHLVFVTGVFRDKEYGRMMELLCPMADRIYTVTPPGERGLAAETLAQCIRQFNPCVCACDGVEQALVFAVRDARRLEQEGKKTAVVAWGSLSWIGRIDAQNAILDAGCAYREKDQASEGKTSEEQEPDEAQALADGDTEQGTGLHPYADQEPDGGKSRLDRILQHPEYLRQMRRIEEAERDRVFCRHGLAHALDVARIMYIMALTYSLDYGKELIYAAALLHDIGRAEEYERHLSHHEEGARIAEGILKDCGFEAEQIERITGAIRQHRGIPGRQSLEFAGLLCKADKLSRNCFACRARKECNWKPEKQNDGIWI